MTFDREKELIESEFTKVEALSDECVAAVERVIEGLSQGMLRVATNENGVWTTQQWLKKAILLYFRHQNVELVTSGAFTYFDKIPVRRWTGREGVRVVPQAVVRRGAYVGSGSILMPCYVNIGAYVNSGTLVDTWATVGSCAQVGKNVHLSGGVGLGGVLEPIQSDPVTIEDGAFIGSRSIIVEGVVVEKEAVIGANVTLTASTRIIDVTQKEPIIYRGRVPTRSVVVSGTFPKEFPGGTFQVSCALIIGKRGQSTDQKTSLNEALRTFQIDV